MDPHVAVPFIWYICMLHSYSSFKTQALLSLWLFSSSRESSSFPFLSHMYLFLLLQMSPYSQHHLFVFLSAPWDHELLWGEGTRLLSLSITSTVFDTQKELSKVGKRESKKSFHCFGGRQRCCELWGATEDGAKEAYGVVSPPIPGCRFHRIFS